MMIRMGTRKHAKDVTLREKGVKGQEGEPKMWG